MAATRQIGVKNREFFQAPALFEQFPQPDRLHSQRRPGIGRVSRAAVLDGDLGASAGGGTLLWRSLGDFNLDADGGGEFGFGCRANYQSCWGVFGEVKKRIRPKGNLWQFTAQG